MSKTTEDPLPQTGGCSRNTCLLTLIGVGIVFALCGIVLIIFGYGSSNQKNGSDQTNSTLGGAGLVMLGCGLLPLVISCFFFVLTKLEKSKKCIRRLSLTKTSEPTWQFSLNDESSEEEISEVSDEILRKHRRKARTTALHLKKQSHAKLERKLANLPESVHHSTNSNSDNGSSEEETLEQTSAQLNSSSSSSSPSSHSHEKFRNHNHNRHHHRHNKYRWLTQLQTIEDETEDVNHAVLDEEVFCSSSTISYAKFHSILENRIENSNNFSDFDKRRPSFEEHRECLARPGSGATRLSATISKHESSMPSSTVDPRKVTNMGQPADPKPCQKRKVSFDDVDTVILPGKSYNDEYNE